MVAEIEEPQEEEEDEEEDYFGEGEGKNVAEIGVNGVTE